MLQFARSMAAVCALTVLGSVAMAQEMVDNPRYQSWARFKPGTTVMVSAETTKGGGTFESEFTSKLIELTAEKAVVEMTVTNHMAPMMREGVKVRREVSPQNVKFEILAKMKKEDVKEPWTILSTMPPGMKAETKALADEDVMVVGKTYKCKVVQLTGEQKGTNLSATVWTCQAVPGEVVKVEQKHSGATERTTKMTVTALDVK